MDGYIEVQSCKVCKKYLQYSFISLDFTEINYRTYINLIYRLWRDWWATVHGIATSPTWPSDWIRTHLDDTDDDMDE